MDLLSKTKIILKCLLISSRKSMEIEDLCLDYTRYEGHPIPYASLGYSNLLTFLASIPDTLTVSLKFPLFVLCVCGDGE